MAGNTGESEGGAESAESRRKSSRTRAGRASKSSKSGGRARSAGSRGEKSGAGRASGRKRETAKRPKKSAARASKGATRRRSTRPKKSAARARKAPARRDERTDRIRGALERKGALVMVYQPIFELRRRHMVGTEALARFPQGPERPTEEWFEEAEEVGLRLELELAAIRAALAETARLPSGAFLALNASPSTVVSDELREIVAGASPERLVIEVSERRTVDDPDAFGKSLGELRGSGVRIALDDAGAGAASLRRIEDLAPDFVKLDISLTRQIRGHGPGRAMGIALAQFASEVGAGVIAEGIETRHQVRALRRLHVRYGQGNHLAPTKPFIRED